MWFSRRKDQPPSLLPAAVREWWHWWLLLYVTQPTNWIRVKMKPAPSFKDNDDSESRRLTGRSGIRSTAAAWLTGAAICTRWSATMSERQTRGCPRPPAQTSEMTWMTAWASTLPYHDWPAWKGVCAVNGALQHVLLHCRALQSEEWGKIFFSKRNTSFSEKIWNLFQSWSQSRRTSLGSNTGTFLSPSSSRLQSQLCGTGLGYWHPRLPPPPP